MENVKSTEIYISINALVPAYIPQILKDIFELEFKAKQVYLCASQTIPIMTSVGRSGIVLDFGMTNISFVVFFKGYILKKHFHFFSKSGLQMLKVLHGSLFNIRENKEVLKTLSFNDKMEVLQNIMTRFVDVPDVHEEREVLDNQTNNSKMRINRRKYISPDKKDVKLSVTYLDCFLTGNFLFEGSQSIQVQMLQFLQEMPVSLSAYLVNNVIITGGLSHIKGNVNTLNNPRPDASSQRGNASYVVSSKFRFCFQILASFEVKFQLYFLQLSEQYSFLGCDQVIF
jgi:hypothetical protein